MDENRIDEIIAKLFKIEAVAVGIQNDAEREKIEYAELMMKKTQEFDENLERETAEKLEQLREQLNADKKAEMHIMKDDIYDQTSKMEELYETNHEQWVNDIVESILKE